MKRLAARAALIALSWIPLAYGGTIIDLGTISSLPAQRFAFSNGFDFHSISFEVTADGPYKFVIKDGNTGPGTFGGGVFTSDVMDKLGLDIKEDLGAGTFGPVLGTAGFDQPASSMDMFTATLEAGKRYVGLFVGIVANGADLGEASLSISAVPVPAPILLLASAIGSLLLVRRRRSTGQPSGR